MNADPTSLDNLHDVIAPPATPWWPPAPGWQALLWFLGLILLIVLIKAFVRWQSRRYRREAIAELERHAASLSIPAESAAAIAGIAKILKRAALTAWPRPDVASLTGKEWADFLDRTTGSDHFRSPAGMLIEQISYDPSKSGKLDSEWITEIIRIARHWLSHHQAEPGERMRK